MVRIVSVFVCMAWVGLVLGTVRADDDGAKKPGADKPAAGKPAGDKPAAKKGSPGVMAVKRAAKQMLGEIELTSEQTAKLDALAKQHGDAFLKLQQAAAGDLTPEQKKARQEALVAGRADGLKGKELQAKADAVVSLSPEAKAKMASAQKELMVARKRIHATIAEMLTPEQKANFKSLPEPKTPGPKPAKT